MKTKILLINPPMTQEEIYAHYGKSAPLLAPLGLCYLAAILLKNGFEVEIMDGIVEKSGKKETIERIKKSSATIVGITATTVGFYSAVRVAGWTKEFNKEIITIIGGAHTSSIPEETIKNHSCFDIGVFGEGEITLLELIKKYNEAKTKKIFEKNLPSINGIAFKRNGKVYLNKKRELIKNLDEIPHPARQLLPDITFYNTNLSLGEDKPIAHIIPSRGCPFNCIYCDQNVFGHRWRSFSTEYIIEEIEDLIKNYKVKTIQFQDDLFTANPKKVEEFCNLIKNRGLKFKWNLSSRVNLINEELAKKMYDAGCRIIYFGIESGDQNMLNFIKKGIKLEQVINTIKIVKKSKLVAHGSFIIGLPGDTKESIEKTINFALHLPLDVATFHIAIPYPNTEFERIAGKYGKVKSRDWSQYRGHPSEVIFTPKGITGEYLLKKQKNAYKRFYFRWKTIKTRLKEMKLRNIPGYIQGAKSVLFN